MDKTQEMLERWCKAQPIKGMTAEIIKLPGRTPILFLEIPGDSDDVVGAWGGVLERMLAVGGDEEGVA